MGGGVVGRMSTGGGGERLAQPLHSSTKAVLYLGGSKPDKQVTVPDLTGHTLSQAKNTLQNLGLYILVSGGVSEGTQTVTKQEVAAQSQVAYGTVITVETTDMAQQSQ